jgi:adenylate kinase family enzyme
VVIIGCGGSGKSYVALKLDSLLNLPVTHMDAVYFDNQWNPLPMERLEAVQRELVAAPRWVIDGNYNSTIRVRLGAADTVVFMDLPTHVCLWVSCLDNCDTGVGRTIRTARTTESPATSSATCWATVERCARGCWQRSTSMPQARA